MPALQKKHKKSSVHNIKSVMNTRYGCGESCCRLPTTLSCLVILLFYFKQELTTYSSRGDKNTNSREPKS